MYITLFMIATYILFCMRFATKPCKYFQLNANYFDRKQGIYSKLAIDELIPSKWRLPQQLDTVDYQPGTYPVFLKPEWGQNASGIQRADSWSELQSIRLDNTNANVRYLIQQGATEVREFEIFWIIDKDTQRPAVMTVTEAINHSEQYPINSIYNDSTQYKERTLSLTSDQLDSLWQQVVQLGQFRISRVSARADSIEALCAGQFHIIEINLFLPMPINLLDKDYSRQQVFLSAFGYMRHLALATKWRDLSAKSQPVLYQNHDV